MDSVTADFHSKLFSYTYPFALNMAVTQGKCSANHGEARSMRWQCGGNVSIKHHYLLPDRSSSHATFVTVMSIGVKAENNTATPLLCCASARTCSDSAKRNIRYPLQSCTTRQDADQLVVGLQSFLIWPSLLYFSPIPITGPRGGRWNWHRRGSLASKRTLSPSVIQLGNAPNQDQSSFKRR